MVNHAFDQIVDHVVNKKVIAWTAVDCVTAWEW